MPGASLPTSIGALMPSSLFFSLSFSSIAPKFLSFTWIYCILEVRAGDDDDIILQELDDFVMKIFRMYNKYAQKNRWKFDVINIMESVVKGYKEVVELYRALGYLAK